MLFWGASFVFTKHLLTDLQPTYIIFLRLLLASIIFLLFSIIIFGKKMMIARKDFPYFIGLTFFEPFLYFLFETYSLQLCDASVVAVIIATIPLFISILAIFYFKERLSALNFFGIGISIFGIVIMLYPNFLDSSFSFTGIALAFGAVLCTLGYNFFLKKIPVTYSPIVVITWQNLLGLIAFLPVIFIFNKSESLAIQTQTLYDPINFTYLLLLAVFCSSLAFILYVNALRVIGMAKTSIFTNLIPVITAIISFFLLHEQFTIYKILGIFIAISGILLVQIKKRNL